MAHAWQRGMARLALAAALAGASAVAGAAMRPGPRPPRPVRAPLGVVHGELPPGPETPPEKLPAQYYGALGQVYLQYQQWAKAQESFQKAYEKEKDDPRRVQYAYSLARLYMRTKDYKKALPLLEEAVKHAPSTSHSYEVRRYRTALASLYEKTGQPEKAVEVYRQWLKSAPKGYERSMARRGLLRSLQRAGKLDTTTQAYEAALKKTPDDREALETLRLIYTSIRPDAAKALAVTEKLAELDPDSRDAAMYLLSAYERARKFNKAIALVNDMAKRFPADRDYLTTRLVYLYIHSGQKSKALDLAKEMLEKGPKTSEAHGRVASIYLQLQMTTQALEQYEEAARLAKRPADRERYLLSAAHAARRAKQYAQAERFVEQLLRSESRTILVQARRLLFELYEEQKKLHQLQIRPGKR